MFNNLDGKMSKRFGRNQKRKMRQQLEDAKLGLTFARRKNRYLESQYQRLAEPLNILKANLSKFNGLCEVEEFVTELDARCLRIEEYAAFDACLDLDRPYCKQQTIMTHALRYIDVEAVTEHFKGVMHIRVNVGDGRVAYGVTDEYIRLVPSEIIAERVTREMMPQILNLLNGK